MASRSDLGSARRSRPHLAPEHPQRASDDHRGRQQHVQQQRAGDHRLAHVARRLLQNVTIHWLHAQAAPNSQIAYVRTGESGHCVTSNIIDLCTPVYRDL